MRSSFLLGTLAAAALALAACSSSSPTPSPAPSGSAPASASASAKPPVETYGTPISPPVDPARVMAALDPDHKPPYAGPTATLKGKVRLEGDAAPASGLKFDAKCAEAPATYGKLFRVGLDNGLADAMVTVTRYQDRGWVPPKEQAVKAGFRGCAAVQRTYVLTFGQRLEVTNLDRTADPYIPMLDGAPSKTMQVAVPGGAPIKLYPMEPGHYMLRDSMDRGPVADVFVLKYATHAVTGLDGRYEISGIPVGKVRVDAFLPVISKSQGQEIELKEGENTLDVVMKFDAKKDVPGGAVPASSASAAPSAKAPPPNPKVPR
jgi:hypothetical protein